MCDNGSTGSQEEERAAKYLCSWNLRLFLSWPDSGIELHVRVEWDYFYSFVLKSWWHISRKSFTCLLLGISIKILRGGGYLYRFCTFLLNSKNVAYHISFVISVLTLTEFASHTQTLNHCVKYVYRNKRVKFWTCRLTEYWSVFELWPYRQFIPLTCTWFLSSETHALLSVFICMLLRWKIIEFELSLNGKIFWEISKKSLEKKGIISLAIRLWLSFSPFCGA
jgi:hypothetical protein